MLQKMVHSGSVASVGAAIALAVAGLAGFGTAGLDFIDQARAENLERGDVGFNRKPRRRKPKPQTDTFPEGGVVFDAFGRPIVSANRRGAGRAGAGRLAAVSLGISFAHRRPYNHRRFQYLHHYPYSYYGHPFREGFRVVRTASIRAPSSAPVAAAQSDDFSEKPVRKRRARRGFFDRLFGR